MSNPDPTEQAGRPRLGISTCLLGEKVRYDGGHKRDRFLTDTLGRFVEWVPVCPEVECGLPTPREAMHLAGAPDHPRLVTSRTGRDLTEQMLTFARRRVRELEAERLVGYIFKAHSPSSGLERVKVYDRNHVPHKVGVGLFARAFIEHFPLLPVEEEGRLHDVDLRENFIERIFALARYRASQLPRRSLGRLVEFHARHKLQLMSHDPAVLKAMGQLVAAAKGRPLAEVFVAYEALLLRALKTHASPRRHVNVLQHMSGYFKRELDPADKAELVQVIGAYRQGLIPLIVPVTLLKHHVRRFQQPYLADQTYLDPHPFELKLRNHA
jgi:uncharacterized protein YbgA (DUF1722 family)/uncharacterized protein YbbK (DUF523 family)